MKVYVDKELCKNCHICSHICPKGVFGTSTEVNRKGYNFAVAQKEEECVGCRQCEKTCPDFAIYVEKDK
ncbi:MAG: ferredoxin family protein [Clostridiaceae bacterium]